MNKINRKLEYALIGLKHMRAKMPGELTSVKELTQAYGCSFEAASRVMQVLAQKGVLRSEQGAQGGYMIARDLTRLSFHDLSEMLLGSVSVARCLDGEKDNACDMRETCNIISPVTTLNRRLLEFYKSLSVAELLESKTRGAAAVVHEPAQVVAPAADEVRTQA